MCAAVKREGDRGQIAERVDLGAFPELDGWASLADQPPLVWRRGMI
jgi:hypothetical protein